MTKSCNKTQVTRTTHTTHEPPQSCEGQVVTALSCGRGVCDDDDDDKFTLTKYLTPPPHHSSRPAAAHTGTETPLQ